MHIYNVVFLENICSSQNLPK